MPDSLIPISDEQAKLGQEILKTLRGMGSFIERALGSSPEDLIAYCGGDWLRVRRAENLVKLFVNAKQRLAGWSVSDWRPASLSVALPILQGAADEDRDELVDLWARLLANAMDPNLNTIRQSFIQGLKKMDPMDAVVLRYIHESRTESVRSIGSPPPLSRHDAAAEDVSNAIACRDDEVEVSIRHLRDLSFIEESTFREQVDENAFTDHLSWRVNATGREFLRACYPEVQMGKSKPTR